MRPLLAVACLVLLTSTLAGCANEDPERFPDGVSGGTSTGPAPTSGGPASTGTSSATGTSTGPAGDATGNGTGNETGNGTSNHVPTASLSASPVNGTAPLNVTFELSGSDEDGDPLNWTLTFGDGNETKGDTLPATVVHSYNASGNFSAVLRVVDPDMALGSSEVEIEVTGGVAAPDLHCHRTPTDGMAPLYVFEGDGGTWVFVEANDIPGLQVENNHPSEATGQAETLGEHNAAWEGCVDGDQMVF